jgi:hypothetical protein
MVWQASRRYSNISLPLLHAELRRKYSYVRYTWWMEVDIDELGGELSAEFEVKPVNVPESTIYELSLYKNMREETLVKADTLGAYISRFRAVLFQRDRAPFTSRDMELRSRILEVYPRDRPSPFPWAFSEEEPFEVAE